MSPAAAKTKISEIKGSRPSPLKLNKDSRLIHKPASSGNTQHAPPQLHRINPVIIYTHSPKIIHIQPRDFMALVQQLTGMSSALPPPPPSNDNYDTSSSTLTDEKCGGGEVIRTDQQVNALFGDDIPLFTPNSSADFFCSPRLNYRFSDASPNSLFDFMASLPEY